MNCVCGSRPMPSSSRLGAVTPRITARASLKRINTLEITPQQRDAVNGAFDFMIRRMRE